MTKSINIFISVSNQYLYIYTDIVLYWITWCFGLSSLLAFHDSADSRSFSDILRPAAKLFSSKKGVECGSEELLWSPKNLC